MSGRKARSVANPLESAITTPSERILKECHSLYVDTENGLVNIASSLGVRLLPPRKKIVVMIMGNHSAGKSSFINWYVEEHIQKTGVAIETQGFTFITSGRKRESLTGNATLHLYPHFRPLLEFKGVTDYLSAEISTSKQKKFSLVTFVDTPGLVDGDMVYPFDVNSAITWLGEQADLIFVFFDPMGQALCKRTLNIVEKLSEKCGDKLMFYLSKADEAGSETDRQVGVSLPGRISLHPGGRRRVKGPVCLPLQRVMMQIVQELCRRPGLNKCGFEMPTIYIPNPQKVGPWCSHLYLSRNFNYIQIFELTISCPCVAEPLREPDRRCVSDHRENHQPGRAEDFGSAGERLRPRLFHHQQQIGQGQSGCGVQQKRPSALVSVWGPGHHPPQPLRPQPDRQHRLRGAAERAAGPRGGSLRRPSDRRPPERRGKLYDWYLQECAAEYDL
ncbi:unnamed protein product [Tetraodon nigroviridis]|uniref:(spotted green pufferfish) hypothetical protein n=1 Tax=Tetraodon nigroviridis TaxID=99883 RepID=Q4RST8_TETNG|nr:unnamed protein product [Tetraodon nigroviridis]